MQETKPKTQTQMHTLSLIVLRSEGVRRRGKESEQGGRGESVLLAEPNQRQHTHKHTHTHTHTHEAKATTPLLFARRVVSCCCCFGVFDDEIGGASGLPVCVAGR